LQFHSADLFLFPSSSICICVCVCVCVLGSLESRCWYNLHHLLDWLIGKAALLGGENSQFRYNRASNV
jgi:hypothetical protein